MTDHAATWQTLTATERALLIGARSRGGVILDNPDWAPDCGTLFQRGLVGKHEAALTLAGHELADWANTRTEQEGPPMPDTTACGDCAVVPGQRHLDGCSVARCKACGVQALQCDRHSDQPVTTWTGEWPGEVECREFGWWARWTVVTKYSPDGLPDSGKLVPCPADHPHARTDLNRLAMAAAIGEIAWSSARERYVRPAAGQRGEA